MRDENLDNWLSATLTLSSYAIAGSAAYRMWGFDGFILLSGLTAFSLQVVGSVVRRFSP
jgi:hypothetical protein